MLHISESIEKSKNQIKRNTYPIKNENRTAIRQYSTREKDLKNSQSDINKSVSVFNKRKILINEQSDINKSVSDSSLRKRNDNM